MVLSLYSFLFSPPPICKFRKQVKYEHGHYLKYGLYFNVSFLVILWLKRKVTWIEIDNLVTSILLLGLCIQKNTNAASLFFPFFFVFLLLLLLSNASYLFFSFYLLTPFTHFSHPQPLTSGNHQSVLSVYDLAYFF